MTAVTGYEQAMVDTLLTLLPGARRDRAGSAVLTLGTGATRRLAACPLDEPGFAVGGVRSDGYLTLRRVPGPVPPLFEQQLEGQRVTVYGVRGALPGVVAVRSIHLTRDRGPGADTPFTLDSAFLDLGASSGAEAARLGARVLSPVTLAKRPHRYGRTLLAAPVAGRRAACAALLLSAREAAAEPGMVPRGEAVHVAFVVEQRLSGRGLATLAAASGPFRETLILSSGEGEADTAWPALGRVERRALAVRYAGSPVETVSLAAADSLRSFLRGWIGGT